MSSKAENCGLFKSTKTKKQVKQTNKQTNKKHQRQQIFSKSIKKVDQRNIVDFVFVYLSFVLLLVTLFRVGFSIRSLPYGS